MSIFSKIESLFELADTITEVASNRSFVQNDFKHLRNELRNLYEQTYMNSFFGSHKNWSVISGNTAYRLFLFRNWAFRNNAKENRQEFKKIAKEIREDYYPSDSIFLSEQEAARIMNHLDERYDFSNIVLEDQHILIFCLECSHRLYDSLCRSVVFTDDTIGADIYMLSPSSGEGVTPQSVFLHELGHVFTIMLTGNANIIPADFTAYFNLCFPNIENHPDANEIFAHCFAMAVMTRPEFQMYDPFVEVHPEDKKLFDKYFRLKFEHWNANQLANGFNRVSQYA